MPCKSIIVTIALIVFTCIDAAAQLDVNQDIVKTINQPVAKVSYNIKLNESKNPLEGTAIVLFNTYKTFVSPQDMSSCTFHPSCSAYAMEAIKKDNVFTAYLKIFDRLTRCHPLIKDGQYKLNKKTGLYHDPVH